MINERLTDKENDIDKSMTDNENENDWSDSDWQWKWQWHDVELHCVGVQLKIFRYLGTAKWPWTQSNEWYCLILYMFSNNFILVQLYVYVYVYVYMPVPCSCFGSGSWAWLG